MGEVTLVVAIGILALSVLILVGTLARLLWRQDARIGDLLDQTASMVETGQAWLNYRREGLKKYERSIEKRQERTAQTGYPGGQANEPLPVIRDEPETIPMPTHGAFPGE